MWVKTRVILQRQDELKSFIFILPSIDGSIYFGSSHPTPQEEKVFVSQLPDIDSGKLIIKFKDGKDITPSVGKFSYHPPSSLHPSSVVHYKKEKEKASLFEYKVGQLEKMADYRKLFMVIPKDPKTFPQFNKKLSKNDIVIPVDIFKGQPFCVDVYLCNKSYNWNRLVSAEEVSVVGLCENKDYLLVLKLYYKSDYLRWPTLTTFIPFCEGVNLKVESIP